MLLTVAIVMVSGYLLFLAYVYTRQGKMLYFPTKEIEATPLEIGLRYQELTLKTTDNIDISAWLIPAEQHRGVVLFCHGNAGNISHRLDSIRIFHELGLTVLIFDYRGYGRSKGTTDEQGTYRDAEAAWDYITTVIGTRPEKIVLFGRSLGSAVAAELALRKHSGLLIIESGFTSVPDLGKKFFPLLPVKLISRYHYKTVDKVGRITIPKLIIHSPDDEIVPYEQGIKIFEKAAEPKEFLRIHGGHNEGFLLSGDLYKNGLQTFLSRYLSTEK